MNKKTKLLNALQTLEMKFSDKKRFVDLLVDNSSNEGGGGSNYKYYDCSGDTPNENGELLHDTYLADSMKIINIETGEIRIAPEAYFADGEYKVLAIAYDMSKRIYINGAWLDAKTFLELQAEFDFSAHQEITEEEFYHIPEDIIIKYRDYNKLKEVFDKLESELTKKGVMNDLPVDVYWYYAPKLDIPTFELGYNSISIEIKSNGDIHTSGNNIIGRVWKQTYEFSSNDFWFDYDIDENLDFTNINSTYIEIPNTYSALCKIVFADKSEKYIVRGLFG